MITQIVPMLRHQSAAQQNGQGPSVIKDVKNRFQVAVACLLTVMKNHGCFFIRNGDIVLSKGNELIPLTKNRKLDSEAQFILANYVCERCPDGNEPLRQSFLRRAFHDDRFREGLPVIEDYSLNPVYDKDLVLREPGYHRDMKMLVHGERNDPISCDPEAEDSVLRGFLDRLHALPFKEDIDYVNMIGVFLMAILGRPLAPSGKMFVLLDGDEPGLGKTLLGELVGLVADGRKTVITEFTSGNDELSKKILSTLKSHEQSVLLFDNARTGTGKAINLTSLESLSSSKTLSLRILGSSNNFVRTNRYVWMLTMNDTKTTTDLANRGMLIRLSSERRAACSSNCYEELETFVSEYHREILASLYGMIEYWKSQERPEGTATHRFAYAARVIGGILDSCGLPGFLSNHEEVIRTLDSGMDDLMALFETTMELEQGNIEMCNGLFHVPALPRRAQEWLPIVENIGIAKKEIALSKSSHGKKTALGKRLQQLINKPFPVEVDDRSGTTILIKESLSSNAQGYHFVVSLDPEVDDETAAADLGTSE